jgi:succinate dehydrogenase / fumarate reductase cytochrome b subunit
MRSNQITYKKLMGLAGLVWFAYLLFHLYGLLFFHLGEESFNSYYGWLNNSPIDIIFRLLLLLSLGFHIYVAVYRQLSNNNSLGSKYKKTYPKAIPRSVAWSGALMILFFIVFHYFQMHEIEANGLYKFLVDTMLKPEMLLIYSLGLITITAHLHHGLTNVFQSLGVFSKQYNLIVSLILVVIMAGYTSIPLRILYA